MDARYDFGRNWSELAAQFEDRHLEQATADLCRLVGDVAGKSFLDIGCGSGLHSAAALRLGARRVVAVDYDQTCVATTEAVLGRFSADAPWTVSRADALDPDTLPAEKFDVVYSWGVLHHTGDMWSAIRNAASRVADGGRFAIALYLKTPLCRAWTIEKRLYSSNRWLRPLIKYPYSALLLARSARPGAWGEHLRTYRERRGMEFMADVDDWLGGYPYESVAPGELVKRVEAMGFHLARSFNDRPGIGVFGTGCGEWCFDKAASPA